jgi:hypothetical protein
VWSEKKLKEKLHYMHGSPLKRKLVEHPKDWPWSSWSFYAKGEGLIAMDVLKPKAGENQTPHLYEPEAKSGTQFSTPRICLPPPRMVAR